MKKSAFAFTMMVLLIGLTPAAEPSLYDFTMTDIDGNPVPLAQFKGKVILVINVASKCGLTPQYKNLQNLYDKYKDRGLVILGFPANNFLKQEPGSNEEIKEFCSRNYGVTFPIFAKISVKGKDIAPLYKFLTDGAGNPELAGEIRWNFDKFLFDRSGRVAGRFAPKTSPEAEEVLAVLENQLTKN